MKEAKKKSLKKTTEEYRLLKRYEVFNIDGEEKLIKPVVAEDPTIIHYAIKDDLFNILNFIHSNIEHSGRNRMAYD